MRIIQIIMVFAVNLLALISIANEITEKEFFLIKEVQINIDGLPEEKLDQLSIKYINQNFKAQQLKELTGEISKYFTDEGYFPPKIKVFPDDLKKSVLKIHIAMLSINEVILDKDAENNSLIKLYAKKLLSEKPTKISTIKKYIGLMNNIPGYYVDFNFKITKNNQLDMFLKTTKTKAGVYLSSDSYGNTDLGQMQNFISTEIYSPFGSNDAYLANIYATNHANRSYNISIGYKRIVNNYGTSANFLASCSEDNSTYNNFVTTDNGLQRHFRFDLTHPIFIGARQKLEAIVGGSYNSQKTYTGAFNLTRTGSIRNRSIRNRSRPIINRYSRLDTNSKYLLADIAAKYSLYDNIEGVNFIELLYAEGIDGKFEIYTDPNDIPDQHYNYTIINITRDQALPYDFSIFTHVRDGYSNGN